MVTSLAWPRDDARDDDRGLIVVVGMVVVAAGEGMSLTVVMLMVVIVEIDLSTSGGLPRRTQASGLPAAPQGAQLTEQQP